MTGGIRRQDIEDLDIVDAIELASDGSSVLMEDVTVVSTAAATKRVVLSGVYIIHDTEQRVEPGDIVVLSGTTGGADGTYTVASVVDDTTFTVKENIVDSTGGSADFYYSSGSLRVGFDHTGLSHTTAHNVQDAIKDLDSEISAGGLTAEQHKTLRQLIHFIETNSPGEGFGDGPLYCETGYSTVFPINETWYETSAKLKKICRWEGTYNANKTFSTEKWVVYKSDGVNAAADATDTISYSGVLETSRSRAVNVY